MRGKGIMCSNTFRHTIHLCWISLLFIGCNEGIIQPSEGIIRDIRPRKNFKEIVINNDFDVTLHQSDSLKISIQGPKDIVQEVQVDIANKKLSIANSGKQLWLKGFPRIEVHIYAPSLRHIYFHGTGKLISTDTLHFNNLTMHVTNAYGHIDLLLTCDRLALYTNSSTRINLSGKANHFRCGLYYNDGHFNTEKFQAKIVDVTHRGENSVHLYATDTLKGELWNVGDIYYYGQPTQVNINDTGEGSVIKK